MKRLLGRFVPLSCCSFNHFQILADFSLELVHFQKMNCILSSGSSSLHPLSSMTSSSTSSSSQHHCKNWLSSGRLRVKQPLAINASPSQVYKYVLKYDIFYVFGLGTNIYIWFDLIWFFQFWRSMNHPLVLWVPTKKLGLIGLAVLTFIV